MAPTAIPVARRSLRWGMRGRRKTRNSCPDNQRADRLLTCETYRKCMPYHLAIHKVVADVAPHQSPGRNEFHAQQSIHRGTISTKKKKSLGFGSQVSQGSKQSMAYCPSQRNTTKLARAIAAWVVSNLVISSQAFLRRSELGASGQALERACLRKRVCI